MWASLCPAHPRPGTAGNHRALGSVDATGGPERIRGSPTRPGVPAPPVPKAIEKGTETVSDDVRNVIIIGSGPAGYTAAVYAARGDLKPLVFEGSVTAGGALMNTTDVENYPGFADGIMGPDLMDGMRKQAERFGAELITDDVTEVDLTSDPKIVKVGDDVYRAHAVIVATGSQHRKLGLPREDALSGRGVSWCATCDGFFFRDQDIAVVGGGDTAMEEAIFLTKFARTVTVVHRRDELRASRIMQDRAFNNDKIRFAWDSEVVELHGEEKLSGVRLRNVRTGAEEDLAVTGLFIAIGHDPRSDLFTGQLDTDDEGYLVVDAPTTRTNLPGVFASGDVVDHTYRQAITAAGTGCAAAIDAERWLQDRGEAETVPQTDPAVLAGEG
ncbi:thioredoxin-disulfide reductase [Actinomadura logoneensis]|uniref:Thioredoxin reductase n=1 Tax=Actinomadura logoneensis TaxID=2293572 RepID=A0A372JMW2_9ACTN|nr:thioredoxin-disulfide reductase [Actinomadura logoneensis]